MSKVGFTTGGIVLRGTQNQHTPSVQESAGRLQSTSPSLAMLTLILDCVSLQVEHTIF